MQFVRPYLRSLLKLTAFALGLAGLFLFSPDALAQSLTLDMGPEAGASSTGRVIQLVLLLTVLSLAPSILIMMTSFTRIVVVLAFLRTALGTQQTPPTQVLISLALFLTLFIMMPTFERVYDDAVTPLLDGAITEAQAMERATAPFEDFMMRHVREKDLALFIEMAGIDEEAAAQDMPMRALVPAFMISELRRAFEIGFLLFIPFLIIDMVVASVLMAMGMMMLPPVMIAMPFKLIFFVLVDGWYMTVGSLVRSYGGG
ncbi:MAG: flagellar type III secretion system pore protein FliP [Alphaproteobacteria bacterium]|nr:flagellar type III secretion system pore protein FliP [Alphaproteobacteria bacterium]